MPGADTVINGLDKAWSIVKDNKPDSSAKSSFCQAVPASIAFTDLYGWQKESVAWSFEWDTMFGLHDAIDIAFKLDYLWNGQAKGVRGLFLNNLNVWCSNIDVGLGWTVNIDATVAGNAYNSGSKDAPIGAIDLLISLQVKSMLQSSSKTWKITAHGNRALEMV